MSARQAKISALKKWKGEQELGVISIAVGVKSHVREQAFKKKSKGPTTDTCGLPLHGVDVHLAGTMFMSSCRN